MHRRPLPDQPDPLQIWSHHQLTLQPRDGRQCVVQQLINRDRIETARLSFLQQQTGSLTSGEKPLAGQHLLIQLHRQGHLTCSAIGGPSCGRPALQSQLSAEAQHHRRHHDFADGHGDTSSHWRVSEPSAQSRERRPREPVSGSQR